MAGAVGSVAEARGIGLVHGHDQARAAKEGTDARAGLVRRLATLEGRVGARRARSHLLQVAAELKRASEPKHELKLCSLEGVTASRFDGLRRWLIAEQVAGADSGGAAPGAEGEPRGPGKHRRQAGVTGEAARRGAEGIG